MKSSRNNNVKLRMKKKRRRLGLIVATVYLMIFLIGELTSDPEESIHQVATSVAEQSIIQDTIQPEKQKRPDGKPMGKVVYLTFDDGPSILTNQFLDVLKEQDVKAIFFMQGSNLQKTNLQKNVKRATKEGHYVGAHSMTHIYKNLYDNGQFVPEMNETLSLIQDITGTNPKLVRPPYGSAPGLESEQIRNQIVGAGIKIWDWTIDSNDWVLKDNPNQIVENVKKGTKHEVEVVLMHEKSQTLQALPEIIAFYREKGYEFGVYNDADHFSLNFYQDKYL
ncbi:polysaccharide deacetylase family protein [Paenibacillus macquariensis]|uniref:Peptidoglycan/xylan/chitin deacetylase, PgdA/CDA1 family n=1 Tax=Paenibacillus macquariensis TaxID=948756 RepID=A0ABY1KEG9_9BACL|nr:polysaccharide deacetylase family protein [Paenibacillus macquariensis]MEC0093940.1 polysaccharide deacetylase [Paenibacillus macquariensis]OAB26911.1 peptidoglycan-N-acetylglucosamine deacetylase [Paenibacillus macquariensis subsp. macquariensis]SIR71380.1 Peptidoglycan/xylan/chitin deacetylase, PgdA/CDA1 family [Paenibacillus macquariensis]